MHEMGCACDDCKPESLALSWAIIDLLKDQLSRITERNELLVTANQTQQEFNDAMRQKLILLTQEKEFLYRQVAFSLT